jgi:glycerate kinase
MRFLIAPDKFKGSLEARAVAENIASGIREVIPLAEIEIAPIADGGEGTAEIIGHALRGEWVSCRSHDALGRAIDARYIWVSRTNTAVMEMSEAAGLRRLKESERDPARASTIGVGEMMCEAMKRGAQTLIIGLGGSATNDGGFGMARSLGFRFFGKDEELTNGAVELTQLTRIERAPKSTWPKIVAAVDVRNPLSGGNGATRVFAAQKGAKPEQMELLEVALAKLADMVTRDLGRDFREHPGAGAAGGLGFGLMSFCDAQLKPGFEVVAKAIGLEKRISEADVIITGEGRLDSQTMEGKAPAGVAMLARKFGKPVYAIVGEDVGSGKTSALFKKVLELARPPATRSIAMTRTGQLARARAVELARTLGDQT